MRLSAILSQAIALMLGAGTVCAFGQVAPLYDHDEAAPIVELDSTVATDAGSKQSAGLFAYTTERTDGPGLGGSGRSRTLGDGTLIWEVGYRSAGALSMSVTLSHVSLPEGGSLTVRSKDGGQVMQVATTESNRDMDLGSPIVDGEEIFLQYIGPSIPAPSFAVSSVCRGFRSVDWQEALVRGGNRAGAGEYGSSKTCEVVAACNTSATEQRRAVCRLIVNNSMIGTGTLVNNTAQDGMPYVLTSAHVIPSLPIKSCKARFCFEETTCNAASYNLYSQEIVGATLVCYDERSDMALLKLSEAPGVASRPYWAGWNTSDAPIGLFTCYHHPYGDAKKVSVAPGISVASYTLDKTNSGNSFRTFCHWLVPQWTSGATEGGSSGSSLMDKDGLVVGGLTGGQSSCTNKRNDYFWQLCKAWTLSATDDYISLPDALDPLRTGVTSLQGADLTDGAGTTPYEEVATYSATSEPVVMSQQLTQGNTRLVQRMENPQKSIKVSCIVLSVAGLSIGDTSNKGPQMTVRVVSENTEEALAAATGVSNLCNLFGTDNVVEFVFETPVTIETSDFYTVIDVSGMSADDYVTPFAIVRADGGEDIMVSAYYQTEETLTDSLRNAENTASPFVFRRMGNSLIVEGDLVSEYSVWSIDGKLVSNCEGINTSAMTISTDGWPVGLYVLHVGDSKGNKAKIRFLVK